MRVRVYSWRLLVALIGLILVLFVFGQTHASALYGALLVIGLALIVGSGISWFVARRHG